MTCCDHCVDSEKLFGARTARRDLRRYRKRRMRKSTRLLVDALRPHARGSTLLDIGGGVGAVQHELIEEGLTEATQADASAAYIEASREEAERRGNGGIVEYRHGDFVELAPELEPADLVTLDRVLCCYPDVERLVELSAGKARRAYGIVFPRQRTLTRLLVASGNLFFRARGSAFRTYLHSPERIDSLVRRQGFRLQKRAQTTIWTMAVYVR